VALLLSMVACGGGDDAATAAATVGTAATTERAPVNVVVRKLESSMLTERIQLSGRLEPWVAVNVSTELGGAVELVGFDKGRYVQKGQVLARVGTDLHEAAVQEAEASVTRAQATFDKASRLFERQAVPRQDLIDATGDLDVRKAQLTQSRLRLQRSIITAPISGIAVSRDIEPGEVLAPGSPITVLQRVDRLKAVIGIPESDIPLFEVGGSATLEFEAYPDRSFDGRITFIGPATTGASRTFPAELAVENGDGALRPGMIASASMVRRVFEHAVVVPRDAVHERDVGTVAVVIEGERAQVRRVELGASEGNDVMIDSGLGEGDWLVIEGQRGLVDGELVRLVEKLP